MNDPQFPPLTGTNTSKVREFIGAPYDGWPAGQDRVNLHDVIRIRWNRPAGYVASTSTLCRELEVDILDPFSRSGYKTLKLRLFSKRRDALKVLGSKSRK